jgi:hypothetical protein
MAKKVSQPVWQILAAEDGIAIANALGANIPTTAPAMGKAICTAVCSKLSSFWSAPTNLLLLDPHLPDWLPEIYLRNLHVVVVAILLWPYFANGQENAASIIQHSAEANERDWAVVPEFDNSERDRTKDGDKTYSVTMLEGSPYERLIAVNGKNLSGAKEKEEQQKSEKAVAERQHESAYQRSRRIAKYQADRNRDHTLIQQTISAFDYRLVGKRNLDGFRVHVARRRRGVVTSRLIATAKYSPAWKEPCGLIRRRFNG